MQPFNALTHSLSRHRSVANSPWIVLGAIALTFGLGSGLSLAKDEKKETQEKANWEDPTQGKVDISDFLSNEPPARTSLPQRGQLSLSGDDLEPIEQAHWDEYAGIQKFSRWGKYRLQVRYTLHRAALGVQAQVGPHKIKNVLKHCGRTEGGVTKDLGEVYVAAPGDLPVRVLPPPTPQHSKFTIHEVKLIPACEGQQPIAQKDGSFVLGAKDATTWSENMRYEPKPQKNCLGFWTDEKDFADWEFVTDKTATYKVEVTYGCGGGNHGSDVAIEVADQRMIFAVEDTGGFQNWKTIDLGNIELAEGRQILAVRPQNRTGKAVLDIKQVKLTKVN